MKYQSFFKKLVNFQSIKKGLIKAYSIPLLPAKLTQIYIHPLTKIIRVIGGFSALLVISENHTMFPYPLNFLLIGIALLQLFQIVLISIIKVIYGIRKLIKNPEKFEVRN